MTRSQPNTRSSVVAKVAGLVGLVVAACWMFGLPPFSVETATHGTLSPPTVDGAQTEPLTLQTGSGAHDLQVEIARTPQQQALGLMYRTELAPDHGMLFIHDRARVVTMWMKNTYIPLDMVFINADGTVHHIARRTEPHSEAMISSNGPVKAVLEIGGGEADRYGLKPGDVVKHPAFKMP